MYRGISRRTLLRMAVLAGGNAVAQDILDLKPPPADARLHYGSDALQFGDLRLPSKAGKHPLVVFIHGGYWKAEYTLEHAGNLCAALTHAGAATWNIEYRRVGNPGGGWPGTFDDVGHACEFVRSLGEQHPVDLSRVVLAGHSAGGQLALWMAAQRSINLRSVVALAAVSDLKRAYREQLGGGATARLLGGSPDQVLSRYDAASPIDLLPITVPQVLVHGTADRIVPYEFSKRFAAQSHNARLISLEGAGHFELIDPRSHEWPTVQKAILQTLSL